VAPAATEAAAADASRYLRIVDDEPTTLDPQCTTEYYTVPLNVFDRLVDVQTENGESRLVPSLAERWDISPDGLTYTFFLRPDVRFSNGSALTASDVGYTFTRLLTHPDSVNEDIATSILGAEALRAGEADTLKGFRAIDDLTFEIALQYPYAPFLACLSTPGASILDEQSTEAAGEDFGKTVEATVGTGAFALEAWEPGVELRLSVNRDYWDVPPGCDGLRMLFLTDTVSQRMLYDEGMLDILDLEYLGPEAEYFIHGDIYRTSLVRGPRAGITYVALNESVKPLDDARVRRALQLALDRPTLMRAMVSGRGNVENGIFPHGLLGFDPTLPEIPCDPDAAAALLKEAGYADGFDLELCCTASASENDRNQLDIIAYMWSKIGVRARVTALSSEEYMARRNAGLLPCYVSTWSADYDDPDNFIYTFFGSHENTISRSLCYPDGAVMRRVNEARAIVDEDARLAEYRALERKIVQEDAAWIPLYSKLHLFVVNSRVSGFEVSWNGWSSTNYRHVAVSE
ncbi:MAG: ABC transporter substrate-binding protein, partial [Clostridia bacterium]|nr:ABC transporter substrate-binding protein [Clostridia bacterium]